MELLGESGYGSIMLVMREGSMPMETSAEVLPETENQVGERPSRDGITASSEEEEGASEAAEEEDRGVIETEASFDDGNCLVSIQSWLSYEEDQADGSTNISNSTCNFEDQFGKTIDNETKGNSPSTQKTEECSELGGSKDEGSPSTQTTEDRSEADGSEEDDGALLSEEDDSTANPPRTAVFHAPPKIHPAVVEYAGMLTKSFEAEILNRKRQSALTDGEGGGLEGANTGVGCVGVARQDTGAMETDARFDSAEDEANEIKTIVN